MLGFKILYNCSFLYSWDMAGRSARSSSLRNFLMMKSLMLSIPLLKTDWKVLILLNQLEMKPRRIERSIKMRLIKFVKLSTSRRCNGNRKPSISPSNLPLPRLKLPIKPNRPFPQISLSLLNLSKTSIQSLSRRTFPGPFF